MVLHADVPGSGLSSGASASAEDKTGICTIDGHLMTSFRVKHAAALAAPDRLLRYLDEATSSDLVDGCPRRPASRRCGRAVVVRTVRTGNASGSVPARTLDR